MMSEEIIQASVECNELIGSGKLDKNSKFKNSTTTIVKYYHPASSGDENSSNETKFTFVVLVHENVSRISLLRFSPDHGRYFSNDLIG